MATKARNLPKTRAQRLGEVFSHLHLKTGQADSQLVAFGGNLSGTTTLTVSDTCAVLGQAIIDKAGASGIAVGATSDTAAGQFRKTLIEMDAAGAITFNPGAIAGSAGAALRPAESTDKVVLGVIDTGVSFTGGTTSLAGKMTKEPYWT